MSPTPDESGYADVSRGNVANVKVLRSADTFRFLRLVLLGASLFCVLWFFTGCAPVVPEPVTPTPEPTITPPADPDLIPQFQEWENSQHADTYVLGDVNNNECARCHSPRDWTPVKSEDMPDSCSSCKFTVPQPEMVSEADWNAVQCDSCHRIVDGEVSPDIMWFNAAKATGFGDEDDPYEVVASETELCQKCHYDYGPYLYSRDFGESAHVELQCTDCHDSHTLQATCTDCHSYGDVISPGHTLVHEQISCVACHDASGLEVGPVADGEGWVAFRTTESPGNSGTQPYQSHNLQKTVDCARCHYTANPWGIAESVPAG